MSLGRSGNIGGLQVNIGHFHLAGWEVVERVETGISTTQANDSATEGIKLNPDIGVAGRSVVTDGVSGIRALQGTRYIREDDRSGVPGDGNTPRLADQTQAQRQYNPAWAPAQYECLHVCFITKMPQNVD